MSPRIPDGPKGYLLVDPEWVWELHHRMVQRVSLAQPALSFDGLYEVISGTSPTPLYLDVEVGRERAYCSQKTS